MLELSMALRVVEHLHSCKSYPEALKDIIPSMQKESQLALLDNIGQYTSKVDCNIKQLDSLMEIIGVLPAEALRFGMSLFDKDIETFGCYLIGKKLRHPIFENMRKMLTKRVVDRIIRKSPIKAKVDSANLSALNSSIRHENKMISKTVFIDVLTSYSKGSDLPERKSRGFEVGKELESICDDLRHQYSEFLYLINISIENLNLLRRISFFLLTKADRNQDLNDFVDIWGKGGPLFFSCILFAQESEKESNSDFWKEYYQWIGFNDTKPAMSQAKVYNYIISFLTENRVKFLKTGSGDRQYVGTFRMHSIVANRPMSKNLLIKFLSLVIKSTGITYNDEEDQNEILTTKLREYSKPIIEAKENNTTSNIYLQLPRETALAFHFVPKQVLDFLLPIYDYLEKKLIDMINNQSTDYANHVQHIPPFIEKEVNQYLKGTSIDEVKRVRAALKYCRTKRANVFLNTQEWKLEYRIPPIILQDVENEASLTLTYSASYDNISQTYSIGTEWVGKTLIINEVIIPCTHIGASLKYVISYDDNDHISSKIDFPFIFDTQGEPFRARNNQSQEVFCIGKDCTIVADVLSMKIKDFMDGYSLYESYISEDALIIIDEKLYGIDSSRKKPGYTYRDEAYNNVRYSENKKEYPVIKEFPNFYFSYPNSHQIEDSILITVDSEGVDYSVISKNLIADGRGEMFVRVKINSPESLVNGRRITVKIFDKVKQINILVESFYILKGLKYNFSKSYYTNKEEICVETLDFCDKENLLAGYYAFPNTNSLFKFKLKNSNNIDCRLLLLPPLIEVKADNENIIDGHFWYSEIVKKNHVRVSVPIDYNNLRLVTIDSLGKNHHELKRAGNNIFNLEYLNELADTPDAFVRLLLRFNFQKHEVIIPICNIYYKVCRKSETSIVSYISNNSDFTLKNITTGLKISPELFCDPKKTYQITVLNSQKKSIASWSMVGSEGLVYHQERDLPRGEYTLKTTHTIFDQFLGTSKDVEDYSEKFIYPTTFAHFKEPIKEISSQSSEYLHTIRIEYSLTRTFNPDNTKSYNKGQKICSFYMSGDFLIEDDVSFESTLYFYDKGNNRIFIGDQTLFVIKIIKKITPQRFIIKIKDKEGNSLNFRSFSGYINPRKVGNNEVLNKYTYFEGVMTK